jgi:hypothetical protein
MPAALQICQPPAPPGPDSGRHKKAGAGPACSGVCGALMLESGGFIQIVLIFDMVFDMVFDIVFDIVIDIVPGIVPGNQFSWLGELPVLFLSLQSLGPDQLQYHRVECPVGHVSEVQSEFHKIKQFGLQGFMRL